MSIACVRRNSSPRLMARRRRVPPHGDTVKSVRALIASIAILVAISSVVGACNAGIGEPDQSNTLTVLAGSELKDLAPMFPDIQQATGVKLVPTYIGTLDGAEKIDEGDPSDVAW